MAERRGVWRLSVLELDADRGAAQCRDDSELMGAEAELPIAKAGKPKAKADQPAIGEEGAMDQAAVELDREQQLARHHVSLRGAPDVPAQRLARSELSIGASQPHLDLRAGRRLGQGRRHAPHPSGVRPRGPRSYLQVQALWRPAL